MAFAELRNLTPKQIAARTDEQLIEAIKRQPYNLKHIPAERQTEEMHLAVLNREFSYGGMIEWMSNPSHKVVAKLVELDPYAILRPCIPAEFREDKELWGIAIAKNGLFFCKYIPSQFKTPEMALLAVKTYPRAIAEVENGTMEFLKEAIKINPDVLNYIPFNLNTEETALLAVQHDPWNILHSSHITEEIVLTAIKGAVGVWGEIQEKIEADFITPTQKMYEAVLEQDPEMIEYAVPQTEENCLFAISLDPHVIKYITNQTPKLVKAAIQQDWKVVRELNDDFLLDAVYSYVGMDDSSDEEE